jgi:hypothetical protein
MTGQEVAVLIVDFGITSDQEKCTKLFAMNARKNVKFRLNLQKASQSTARNATLKENQDSS